MATGWETLLAGAALALGVLAACLAVLGTVPASGFPWRSGRCVLAQAMGGVGALGVAGLGATVDTADFGYAVLALGLASCFALVYRLGGGLHGLGRRGLLLAVGALVVLLVVALAYTAALGRWGSPELIDARRHVPGLGTRPPRRRTARDRGAPRGARPGLGGLHA